MRWLMTCVRANLTKAVNVDGPRSNFVDESKTRLQNVGFSANRNVIQANVDRELYNSVVETGRLNAYGS